MLEAPRDLWVVSADTTQIHQVLLNLCVNARDAMPDGGTLTVLAENTRFTGAPTARLGEPKLGSFVLITVSDTGTGIAPDLLDKIFEPFFTTKAPDKGTGLGLAGVRSIMKNHGGFVEVQSEVGKGT